MKDFAEHVRDNVINRDLLNPHHNFEVTVLTRLERIEAMLDHVLRYLENVEADRQEMQP